MLRVTQVLVVVKAATLDVLEPAGDCHEVCHEARHDALKHSRVAHDHVLVIYFSQVDLRHHCTVNRTYSTIGAIQHCRREAPLYRKQNLQYNWSDTTLYT